jgi:ornithine carrier protein
MSQEVLFGAVSGLIGKIVEYPFDTIKVNMQLDQTSSMLRCAQRIYARNGLGSFYHGLTLPLFGSMFESALLFTSYGHFCRAIQASLDVEELTLLHKSIAGGLSGCAVSFLLTPIELIKCQVQAGLKDVRKIKCLRALYVGHGATMVRETLGGAAWFGAYDIMKRGNEWYNIVLAGAVAGMSYNFAFFPADVIKTRQQVYNSRVWPTVKFIWKQSGIFGFYKGLGITLVRSAPTSGIIFFTYELLLSIGRD